MIWFCESTARIIADVEKLRIYLPPIAYVLHVYTGVVISLVPLLSPDYNYGKKLLEAKRMTKKKKT